MCVYFFVNGAVLLFFYFQSEGSGEDVVDSDFDVDESAWGPEDNAEEKLQKELKAQKKKKTWIKPYKDRSVMQDKHVAR